MVGNAEGVRPVGRNEKPVDPDAGPIQRLAHELRALRERAGKPSYREMARRTRYSATALSQAAAGHQLPTLLVVRAYAEALGADPEEWEAHWRRADEAARETVADGDGEPPYRGLARFEPADHDLFFGRDKPVTGLLELVGEHRFAAVFGPSGSGKSSLLRAGLVPALGEAPPADRPAMIRILTPGERPATRHAQALVPLDEERDTWVIVDQFEELFTLCRDREERNRFLELLLAARQPEARLRVVIAVRGDFYGHCAEHHDLADAVSQANVLVGPMGRDELRQAVTGPASAAGLNVERVLTARIIDDVTGQPGALPMLSHALLETWRRRRGRTLTLADYEDAGGVQGAIAATAERVYGELTRNQALAARRILLRLIAPGEGTADTRHPAERSELAPRDDTVLERLISARLVTSNDGAVELAHEALITGWPRLAGWIEEDRERLRVQRRLGEASRAWEELGRDPGALYRGTRLAQAEELFARSRGMDDGADRGSGDQEDDDDLTGPERAFLTASLEARETDREARARSARRTRTGMVAFSVLMVLALVTGLLAVQQSLTGERESAKAAARRVAAVADSLRASDPGTAALLGVAAWKIAPLPESRSALLGGLFEPEQASFTDPQTGRDVRRYLTGEGRTLVSLAGREVTVEDVTGERPASSYVLPRGAELGRVSPDARIVALSGSGGDRLWDMAAGKPVAEPRGLLEDISAGGRSYLTGPSERSGTARLTRTTDGEVLFETSTSAPLTTATVSADGGRVALCPAERPPQVWDTSGGGRLPGAWETADELVCGTGSGADTGGRLLRFNEDGTRLVVLSGTTVRVWDVPSGHLLAEFASVGDGGFTQAALTADGKFLATAEDHQLAVWRLEDSGGQVFSRQLSGVEVSGLAWDPEETRVLRFLDGATVRTYDLSANLAHRWERTPADATALSPDGATLATVTSAGGGYRFELRSTRTDAVLATDDLGALQTGSGTTPLLSFSPDGSALAVADTTPSGGSVRQRFTVWDVGGRSVRTSAEFAKGDDQPVHGIALGPGGRTLLVSRQEGGVAETQVWDTTTGRATRTGTLPGSISGITAVRDDGGLLADSQDQYTALPSGPVTGRALADGRYVTALAFSPGGTRLAVGDASGHVTLWDGAVRRRTGVLTGTSDTVRVGAPEAVTSLAFSPDGGTLAVGGAGGTLRLWDTASWRLLAASLPTPGQEVRSLAFGGDGGVLYASSPHVPLQSYPITAEHAVDRICDRSGETGLPRELWDAYIPDASYRDVCGQR